MILFLPDLCEKLIAKAGLLFMNEFGPFFGVVDYFINIIECFVVDLVVIQNVVRTLGLLVFIVHTIYHLHDIILLV